ncbi:SCO7613 C-terminal domain-containing membrane protein [Streptomyces sp. NPDC048187]|uniref:SCO7613 C-terminal domain-containing membrane protein n=1 Tax=Streptomyces sp. NPDC048187 TaxID=3365509 RepID=UPI003724555F
MTNLPPPAEELRFLDAELRQLDLRRAALLHRREWLIHVLRAAAAQQPGPGSGATPTGGPPSTGAGASAGAVARRPEATAPGVQNVLLVLGGVLLTVAAIAFTVVSWGHLGITGRALILGALTVAAMGAPVVLLRRGLRSTAEAVAALGTALTVLDAYALHEVALAGTGGVGYTAAASAALAALWGAYGLATSSSAPPATEGSAATGDASAARGARPGLRHPLPLAVATAHLPLLLWAVAAGAGPYSLTAVSLATAAASTAVAVRTAALPVRVVAVVGASGTGAAGVLAAGWLCWSASDPGAAARAAGLLVVAAAVALVTGRFVRNPEVAVAAASAAGLCLVAGTGGVLWASLPGEWTVPGCLACGIALLVAERTPLPRPLVRGLVHASTAVQCCAVLWAVPLVAGTVLGPAASGARPWSGTPRDIREAVFTNVSWPPYASTVPLVLAAVTGVLLVAGRNTARRSVRTVGALVLGWAAVTVLPVVLRLPYGAGLVAQGAVVVAALGFAARSGRADRWPSPPALTPLLLALLTSVDLAFLSLGSAEATIAALASLTVLFGAAACRPGPAPFAAPAALGHATALACAIGAWADRPPHHTALLVLVVPAVAAVRAGRIGPRATVPVEVAGGAAGLLACVLAVTDPPALALALSVCGVVAAGTALRPDRRTAGWAAAVLFLLAAWVRLAAWDVVVPEAYTLPVTVPALVVGLLRRRRDTAVSSWTAYGAGLSVTLVPSLLAAWDDRYWLRPLLLGVAALAVTLAGARYRLQAPLVVGAGVLALVTLHELAPYLVQVVGALPRWAPPALAGLALLVLGATYEQRLRDARRLREALGRLG